MACVRVRIDQTTDPDCLEVGVATQPTEISQATVQYMVQSHKINRTQLGVLRQIRNSMASLDNSAQHFLPEYEEHLEKCGRELHAVFFEHIEDSWCQIVEIGSGCLLLDVEPSLWTLPWELLFHPRIGYLDQISRPIARQVRGSSPLSPKNHLVDAPSIYFFGADPIDHATRSPEQYHRFEAQIPLDVRNSLRLFQERGNSQHETPQWLRAVDDLRENPPDVLHISAHGSGADGFVVEGKSREEKETISYHALCDLLLGIEQVKLLVLAACESGTFFEENPESIQRLFSQTELEAAVVMASVISAEAAINFTEYFYQALWQGLDVATAVACSRYKLRCRESELISLQWSAPMIYESSRFNPFGEWLQQLRHYGSMPQLPLEHIETVQSEARRLSREITKLVRLRRQTRASSSRLAYTTRRIIQAQERFENAMEMLNSRYAPEDEAILHEIRVTTSEVFPIVDRFLTDERGWVEDTEIFNASTRLSTSVDYAVELLKTRASI